MRPITTKPPSSTSISPMKMIRSPAACASVSRIIERSRCSLKNLSVLKQRMMTVAASALKTEVYDEAMTPISW